MAPLPPSPLLGLVLAASLVLLAPHPASAGLLPKARAGAWLRGSELWRTGNSAAVSAKLRFAAGLWGSVDMAERRGLKDLKAPAPPRPTPAPPAPKKNETHNDTQGPGGLGQGQNKTEGAGGLGGGHNETEGPKVNGTGCGNSTGKGNGTETGRHLFTLLRIQAGAKPGGSGEHNESHNETHPGGQGHNETHGPVWNMTGSALPPFPYLGHNETGHNETGHWSWNITGLALPPFPHLGGHNETGSNNDSDCHNATKGPSPGGGSPKNGPPRGKGHPRRLLVSLP